MSIYQAEYQVRGCPLNNYCHKFLTLNEEEILQKRLAAEEQYSEKEG